MKKPSAKARGKTKRPNKVDFLKARGKVVRPKPFEKSNKVDFSKFKAVPSASDIAKLAWGAARPKVWQQPPIEVLSPDKTVGRGETYILCGIVDLFYPSRLPGDPPEVVFTQPLGRVAVLFEPSAYGITSAATYIITFNIFVPVGNATFTLDGDGDIPNRGEYTLNDRRTVQAILRNASPHAPLGHLISLQVKEPGIWTNWRYYSSVIKFADPIVSDPIVNPPV
jgi:hypothetical protein